MRTRCEDCGEREVTREVDRRYRIEWDECQACGWQSDPEPTYDE